MDASQKKKSTRQNKAKIKSKGSSTGSLTNGSSTGRYNILKNKKSN